MKRDATTCLFLCKSGFQPVCAHEVTRTGYAVRETRDGGVTAAHSAGLVVPAAGWCFPVWGLAEPTAIPGGSIKDNTRELFKVFGRWAQGKTFKRSWPAVFIPPSTAAGDGPFSSGRRQWHEALRGRMSRVAKLAVDETALAWGVHEGFFAHWDGGSWHASTTAYYGGQARMRDMPGAPSRSYLKLEEAFRILGRAPASGETVADLGAAPGGWSLSAARRGAAVTAVDNGPLKGDAASLPNIAHERADAFTFAPSARAPFVWLLCDIVDRPERVLKLVARWVEERWCRFYVVNLKLGRSDSTLVWDRLHDPRGPISGASTRFLMRQLFHDRDEITLMGEVRLRS